MEAVCSVCKRPLESDDRYPWRVCRDCDARALNVEGQPARHASQYPEYVKAARNAPPNTLLDPGDGGDNPVFIDGVKCWRRYRFGGWITMRDLYNCATLDAFEERRELRPPVRGRPFRRPVSSAYDLDDGLLRDFLLSQAQLRQGAEGRTRVEASRFFGEVHCLLLDETLDLTTDGEGLGGFRITADLGVAKANFGNVTGMGFEGLFRHVRLATPGGFTEVALEVSSFSTTGDEDGEWALAIIGGVEGKQSLQIVSTGKSRFTAATTTLLHKGHISLGEGGGVSKETVVEYLRKQSGLSFVDEDDEVRVGEFPARSLDAAQARDLVLRLAILAERLGALRDELRKAKKKGKSRAADRGSSGSRAG